MPARDTIDLLVTAPGATAPVRTRLRRALTTVGSGQGADLRVSGVAPQWVVVHRQADTATVCVLASGARHPLRRGESVAVDGATLAVQTAAQSENSPLPVGQIADALANVDHPQEALGLLLERVMTLTDADSGAIILKEAGQYSVAAARERDGAPQPGVALLSDTIVQHVLSSGDALSVPDLSGDQRYQGIPSVVDLKLRGVLVVPMVLGDRVVGALYLGTRAHSNTPARAFSDRHAADLAVIASMSIPFLVQLRRAASSTNTSTPDGLIGDSPALVGVRDLIQRVAPSDLAILITGPTGTGKELAARAIHDASRRRGRPMVTLNCAAVPAQLLESELFGYARGAFTGAAADRSGTIEAAADSTLFLDEIGDMPLPMQAAMLRVLQEKEVIRIGEHRARPVDFRLVCATHRDLDAEVAAGRFRADLLFRLREVTLAMPGLAERGAADIALLARLFLRRAEADLRLPPRSLSDAAERALLEHSWPGNVRELRATIRRAAVLADGQTIGPADLGLAPATRAPTASLGDRSRPLADARDAFVADYIAAVVADHNGNREAAAASLGISLRSLYRHR